MCVFISVHTQINISLNKETCTRKYDINTAENKIFCKHEGAHTVLLLCDFIKRGKQMMGELASYNKKHYIRAWIKFRKRMTIKSALFSAKFVVR